jgi:hypothetical protein
MTADPRVPDQRPAPHQGGGSKVKWTTGAA